MKKTKKNNRLGFTLVEMVLVIFIILTLAAVLMINVSTFFNAAREATAKVDSQVQTMGAHDRIDQMKNDYNFS